MHPELFTIPGTEITLYSFGLMVALGVMVASWLSGFELQRMVNTGRVPTVKAKVKEKGKAKIVNISPADLMTNIALIAAGAGIMGAKFFYLLEHLDQFWADPVGMIFSGGGLTWYGGLLGGTIGVVLYAKWKKIPVRDLADAMAPGLILAYGIGRIGCQLAGDGDWGIPSDPDLKPAWLPDFLWAETYPNRIYKGADIPETGVYPTPLYETIASLLIFSVLWSLRKHTNKAGWLFSLYVFFVGFERFLIEKIRINETYEIFGLQMSQAEVISVLLMVLGLVGVFMLRRSRSVDKSHSKPSTSS